VVQTGSHGDHQMIVAQSKGCRSDPGTERHGSAHRINGFNVAGVKIRSWRHASDRGDDMIKFDRTRNHLGQKRLKNNVVVVVDQSDPGGREFANRKHFAEMHGDINSAQPASKNENALLCHSDLSPLANDPYNDGFILRRPSRQPGLGPRCVNGLGETGTVA
jgi:hypothetical protein